MKVIPFPGGGSASPDEVWLAELEAALNGDGEGVVADSWRELRDDVRTLAPPMDPDFERKISERIIERGERSAPKQPHRRLAWRHRPIPLGAAAVVAISAVVALVSIAGSGSRRAGTFPEAVPAPPIAHEVFPGVHAAGRASAGAASAPVSSAAVSSAPVPSGAASAPGRVQQLGASISLSATPSEVQTVADRVARLAVSEGGFVQSSHVNEGEKAGEANLTLSMPSAKLSAALASLGQLAPVRAESQSLQDITNTYDQARQRLNDATAERQALLRALAKASTEGEIDSLRARLAQAGSAIARARTALGTVSKQASTAEVEVTVLGDKSAGSEGLTLHRGLHDAGRVLTVTLIVLLIAVAVLVPLALLIAALATSRRAWSRYRRERILDAP